MACASTACMTGKEEHPHQVVGRVSGDLGQFIVQNLIAGLSGWVLH